MRARRPRPKGRGHPGAWHCQLAHPMAPHRPSLAFAPCIPAGLRRGPVLFGDGAMHIIQPVSTGCGLISEE